MTSQKLQDLVSRGSPWSPLPAPSSSISRHGSVQNDAYLALEEEEYQDGDEFNRLIHDQARRPSRGLRGGSRDGRGPTFADVILRQLGLARKEPNMMINSDIYSTGSQRTGAKAPLGAPALKRSPSIMKLVLLIFLFLTLIGGFVLVILELSSYVEETKVKLGLLDLRKIKQNLLTEIDRNLDDTHRKELEEERKLRWLVHGSKCHIPALDAWDRSIEHYIERKDAMNCTRVAENFFKTGGKSVADRINTTTKSYTFVKDNKLYFTPEAINMGALNARCCYRLIMRSIDNDDDLDISEPCVPIRTDGTAMNRSLIEVSCTAPLNYLNVHSFMLQNKEEEEAFERIADARLNKDNYYNVLMLGVDTMSRLNAQRQLNETLTLLKSSHSYNTIDFSGYNKVGENTFPNLIPLLTGLRPSQLIETQCWLVKNYTDDSEGADDYLDNCKYLWNYYQQLGYATYFSEDWPAASTFNYLKPGFKNEPTTYYGRPFALARQKITIPQFESPGCASCQLDRPIVEVDLENLQQFLLQHHNKPYFAFHWINCPQHDDLNGASQTDQLLRDFLERIFHITNKEKTFVILFSDHGYRWESFVSTRIGHYESSLPLLTIAPPASFISKHADLYENLKSHQNALLTPFDMFKTMIGIRDLGMWKAPAAVANSVAVSKVAGKRQAAIPMLPGFANPIIPHYFPMTMDVALAPGVSYPAMLPQTQLTTPPPGGLSTASFDEVKLKDGLSYRQKFRTISLLQNNTRDQLDRSCIDAGIPDNYCVCHQFVPIQADRLDVLGAAYHLVYGHLESRLRNFLNLCRRLDLEKVHQAEMFDFSKMSSARKITRRDTSRNKRAGNAAKKATRKPSSVKKKQADDEADFDSLPIREYSVMFSTKPGGAMFQEVVRYYGKSMSDCEKAVRAAKKVLDDRWAHFDDRREAVATMNSVCRFSVHNESISRLNLYKEQSKCVKSNIELKKICYCNNLP